MSDQIKDIVYAPEFQMGPMRVRQPLPGREYEQIGPFVLLHHAAPRFYEANSEPPRLGPHPHRGFEPVTFLFQGGVFHRDSMGNEGFIDAGGVQWMTSGSGILHSEGPSAPFLKKGGYLELIQLWVNVPAKDKMTAPKYQDIKAEQMPLVFDDPKVKLKLVSGSYAGEKGPASTFTPIISMMGEVEQGASVELSFDPTYATLVYVLSGKLNVNGNVVDRFNMFTLDTRSGKFTIQVEEDARLLILSAEKINEPVVAQGPFVMNTFEEIEQAYNDFYAGKFGVLTY